MWCRSAAEKVQHVHFSCPGKARYTKAATFAAPKARPRKIINLDKIEGDDSPGFKQPVQTQRTSMTTFGSETHLSILLSILALFVSLWALRYTRINLRRTTEPILTLRILSPAYRGHIDLQNTGAVPATSVRLELIEKRTRPSAMLQVNETLAVGEECTIQAWDFPDELNAEFRENHIEDATTALLDIHRAINNDPTPVAISGDQMAFHLLTRQGGQKIILSCAIPDKARQQRIYKVEHSRLQMCSMFLVGLRARYLRFRFKNNATLRPPLEMPEFLSGDSEQD